jgi:hypothetical protein
MKDDLDILADGRRPEFVHILKATSMFLAGGRYDRLRYPTLIQNHGTVGGKTEILELS